ncbi:hypothetical protein K2X30_15000 [bacterium]|jgi:hypothetical protein|nr:hypothetical protein [bacterium]
MKKSAVVLGVLLAFSASNQAHAFAVMFGGWCSGWTCGTPAGCSPEVVEGNVAATDRVLSDLASQPEFASASFFKSEIARMQALPVEQRVHQYFQFAGINPNNVEEIAQFVGMRIAAPKYVNALKANAGLADAQADRVVTDLSRALRGQLNR